MFEQRSDPEKGRFGISAAFVRELLTQPKLVLHRMHHFVIVVYLNSRISSGGSHQHGHYFLC